jgi:predicted  nucleic acid-binding Zn-ribbon protein
MAQADASVEKIGGLVLNGGTAAAGIDEEKKEWSKLSTQETDYHHNLDELNSRSAEYASLNADCAALTKDLKERKAALENAHTALGKAVLEDGEASKGLSGLPQYEALKSKMDETRRKIDDIQALPKSNVLAHLGHKVKQSAARAKLGRHKSGMSSLYREAGEEYLKQQDGAGAPEGPLGTLLDEARKAQARAAETQEELQDVQNKRAETASLWDKDGSPEHLRTRLNDALTALESRKKALYRKTGEKIEASNPDPGADAALKAEMEHLSELRGQIEEKESQIAHLQASLDVDNERAQIERCNKQIRDIRLAISKQEAQIKGLEAQIEASNKKIAQLQEN